MSRTLTYATVCSGIECCSVAARGLPLRPVFFSEIEPFPCAALIALDLCAAIVYAAKCEWRMALYWAAAAILTACVTYTGGK